jgi:protein-disulfide isomerase
MSWNLKRAWPPRYVGSVAATATLLAVLAASLGRSSQESAGLASDASSPPGPPWRYGRADARFTLIEYADLECPYCQAYFPTLRQWIDSSTDVNWQWHHLPLAMHEPSATAEARMAECAGETGGHAAFWRTVAWIYEHTQGDGRGVPAGMEPPAMTRALRECLTSSRPDMVIRAQADEALRDRITATPTVRLLDHQTGRSLSLPAGAIDGDALSSAIDWLTAPSDESTVSQPSDEISNVPADPVSGTPR